MEAMKIILIEVLIVAVFIFALWLIFIKCWHDWVKFEKSSGVMGHPGFEYIAVKKCAKCGKTRTIAKIID